jgi:O-antigen/teichoic acid export membrane protein
VVTASVWVHFRSIFHAFQQFIPSVVAQLMVDVAKLLGVGVVVLFADLAPMWAIACFAAAPALGGIIGFVRFRSCLGVRPQVDRALARQLIGYGKWLFISRISALLFSFTGLFMMTRMKGDHAAGIFGLALNLSFAFPILAHSLFSVLLPKVARFTEAKQFTRYINSSLKIGIGSAALAVPMLFLAYPVIPLVFGDKYLASIPVFIWLSSSLIVHIVNACFRAVVYAVNKPHALALIDFAGLAAMVTGCWFLIPYLGVLAPALLSLVINIIVFGALLIFVRRQEAGDLESVRSTGMGV